MNVSKEYSRHEQCHCSVQKISYKIIENYRSILDRTQQFISSWKIFDHNGKVRFTHGAHHRKGTDALIIRFHQIYLINPWYKYIDVNKHLLSIVKNKQCLKVFEIVLLECNCLTNLNECELAIIECPCLEQMRTYCLYCRLMFEATEPTSQLFKNAKQQTYGFSSMKFFDDQMRINGTFRDHLGPYPHQRTVQIQVEPKSVLHTNNADNSLSESKSITLLHDDDIEQSSSQFEEDLSFNGSTSVELANYRNQETQTKLFAILLPESPLSEMKSAKTEAITSMNITRLCQVNTLSYLIKSNESEMDVPQMDCSSSVSFLHTDSQLVGEFSTEVRALRHKMTRKIRHHTLTNRKYDVQGVNIPTIQFEREELLDDVEEEEEKTNSMLMKEKVLSTEEQSPESIFPLSSLKCINACDTIDLDKPNTSITSFLTSDEITSRSASSDQQDEKHHLPMHAINMNRQHQTQNILNVLVNFLRSSNNNCEEVMPDYLPSVTCQLSKSFQVKNKHYRAISRKRRQYRTKKLAYSFLQRLCHRKKSNISELVSPSSDTHHRLECHLPSTPIKQVSLSNQRQQSIINLHLTDSNSIPQYKSIDHTIIVRASKNSPSGKQLQSLMNTDDTLLEQLIDSQLTLTCHNHYKSVCILLDDHKVSEQYRSSFLHYIYTTLSDSLKKIIREEAIELTCMNLAFFNNSLCDLVNMRRLRLIDTGRKIILVPSCEIPLKTSVDINRAVNRLSTNMLFAHQIFIINFSHTRSSIDSSFFFLQLAPICSLRPTGLLTNLNSTTYSVLNLIRQLNNGQLFDQNPAKRYLFNDCSLNRLLKSYLFSSQQTMTVITVKPGQTKRMEK